MRALFISSRPLERASNIKAVWDAMADCDRSFTFNGMRAGTYDYTEAEHDGYDVIVTDDFIAPVKDKSHVKIIDIGHGVDGFKLCGKNWGGYPMEKLTQIDYLIAASDWTAYIRSDECYGKVEAVALGVPRTDAYVNGEPKHSDEYEKVYLYVPSWRADTDGDMPRFDWHWIDHQLGDDEHLFVKRHMCSSESILGDGSYEHISEIGNDVPSEDMIMSADVVITDYSSIMADAWVANKPVVLYCPDKDSYLKKRGMYRDYPAGYASYHTHIPMNMIDTVRIAYNSGQSGLERDLKYLFASKCDGRATERVVRFIRKVADE